MDRGRDLVQKVLPSNQTKPRPIGLNVLSTQNIIFRIDKYTYIIHIPRQIGFKVLSTKNIIFWIERDFVSV